MGGPLAVGCHGRDRGLVGGLQRRDPAAVDVADQKANHKDARQDEENGLVGPGPDDRLDAAEGDGDVVGLDQALLYVFDYTAQAI